MKPFCPFLLLLSLVALAAGCQRDVETPSVASTHQPLAPSGPTPYVAYVQDTQEGGTEVAVCYPEYDRTQVVATSAAGEPELTLRRDLPAWLYGQAQRTTRQEEVAPKQVVYLDPRTGELGQPDANIGLSEYERRWLLDIRNSRVLVVEKDTSGEPSTPSRPVAKLILYEGNQPTELGTTWLPGPRAAALCISYHLSPDGLWLLWDGPEGSFGADLRTGKVEPRPSFDKWIGEGRAYLSGEYEAGVRRCKLVGTQSGAILAETTGYVDYISPGGTYWGLRHPEQGERPPSVQLVPGREPTRGQVVTEGPWAIHGEEVHLWATYRPRDRRSEDVTILCRVQREGVEEFEVAGLAYLPEVLTLEQGGRVAMLVGFRPETGRRTSIVRHELVILDFEGKEIVRRECWAQMVALGPAVCTIVFQGDRWELLCIDPLIGEGSVRRRGENNSLDLRSLGKDYALLKVCSGKGQDWRADVYVGMDEGREWRLIAEGVREVTHQRLQ